MGHVCMHKPAAANRVLISSHHTPLQCLLLALDRPRSSMRGHAPARIAHSVRWVRHDNLMSATCPPAWCAHGALLAQHEPPPAVPQYVPPVIAFSAVPDRPPAPLTAPVSACASQCAASSPPRPLEPAMSIQPATAREAAAVPPLPLPQHKTMVHVTCATQASLLWCTTAASTATAAWPAGHCSSWLTAAQP